MKLKLKFLLLLIVVSFSASAQVHLGKTTTEIIAALGTDNSVVHDDMGNKVIAYVNEIKDHPNFGSYTLYSLYVFENDSCIMQQTLMPLNQKEAFTRRLNTNFQKVNDSVWKSPEAIYYLLNTESENLRLQMMKKEIYKRNPR
jgi:hypothetical protein